MSVTPEELEGLVTQEDLEVLKQLRCTVTDLRVRNGQLARAFDTVDKERCFLRTRAKQIQELAKQLESACAMYEG